MAKDKFWSGVAGVAKFGLEIGGIAAIDEILDNAELHIISRFRNDADLMYLYYGESTGKKGQPKKYTGLNPTCIFRFIII